MKKLLLVFLLAQGLALPQTGNGSIEGRIRTADGSEIGARRFLVTARAKNAASGEASTLLDSSGNYHLGNVAPGDYVIVVTGGGVATYFPGEIDSAKATSISLKAGGTVVGIDFTLDSRTLATGAPSLPAQRVAASGTGVTVSGRVLLAPGKSPDNRAVINLQSPGAGMLTASLRPDLTFEVSGVPPGSYLVSYRAANVTASQQIVVANADLRNVELVDLDWVRDSKGLIPVWTLTGTYRGVVWDPAGSVIHVGLVSSLADVDTSGKILKQIGFKSSPNLRLAHFANQGTVLLSFSTWSPSVDAYDLNGKQLWSYSVGAIDDAWATDLDGDGSDEVIVGFNGAVGLHVLDSAGVPVWKDTTLGNVWHVSSGDVGGGGKIQVVSTSAKGQVHVFGSDGKQRQDLLPGVYANMIRMGKISANDPADTIFVVGSGAASSPTVVALSGSGTTKWSLELLGSKSVYSAYLATGKPWLALGMQGGQVEVIDAEHGTIIASIDGQGFNPEMAWVREKGGEAPMLVISTGQKLAAYRVEAGK